VPAWRVASLVISAGARQVAGRSWRLGRALTLRPAFLLERVLAAPVTAGGGTHPVQQGVISDGAGVGRALAQGLAVAFPGPADDRPA
jgi:hypothetical protein